ncbi:hypothetical protein BKA69DRAFT_1127865 [Paraphysoderma sedebokerense]|nr:hypothetical protein BKA69DRAFT_1127912 [Paraphysoderma sedebokerense]KAI9137848.1 hypothetical protein BKA69DRAFT_1127865 [Paraphysoderma sedebokerense]
MVNASNIAAKRERALQRKKQYDALLANSPAMIARSKSKGRYLYSPTALPAGTTILLEQSPAFIIVSAHVDEFCAVCVEPISFASAVTSSSSPCSPSACPSKQKESAAQTITGPLKCDNCDCGYWCSTTCRSNDETHDRICGLIKKLDVIAESCDVDFNMLRLVVTVFLKEHSSAASTTGAGEDHNQDGQAGVINTPISCIKDLITHRKSYDEAWINAMTKAAEELICLEGIQGLDNVTVDEFIDLGCRINSNSHGMGDPSGSNRDCAIGLFPLASMFNHSCKPNCIFSGTKHGQIVVRTQSPVSAGEELTISYIDLYQSKDARREELLTTKFFWCPCERCEFIPQSDESGNGDGHKKIDPDFWLDGIVCLEYQKGCKGVYIKDDESVEENADRYVCTDCRHSLHSEEYNSFKNKIENDYQSARDLVQSRSFQFAKNALESFLKKYAVPEFFTPTGMPPLDSFQLTPTDHKIKLHPHHHFLFNALVPLLNISVHSLSIPASIYYNTLIIETMNQVVQYGWIMKTELADFWYSLGTVYEMAVTIGEYDKVEQRKLEEWKEKAKEAFMECKKIRLVCLGESHGKVKEIDEHF